MFPYYSASQFYKDLFGCKVYKIAIDAGCTCPNRDGTKGRGGCIFCSESGSGDFVSSRKKSITEQIEDAKLLVNKKLYGRNGEKKGKYIAYFQNYTNTYGDAEVLKAKYFEALGCEDIAGIDIATRPDCIGDDILEVIKQISEKYFVTVELGLQTVNEKTGKLINRQYTTVDYLDAVKRIKKANPQIHIVSHLIFGLPGEDDEDMMDSVRFVRDANSDGIKITTLYIVKNTVLADMYAKGLVKVLSKEEYFNLIGKALKIISDNMVVHRITGDPPKNILIEPLWTVNKRQVMNELNAYLRQYN